MVRNNSLNRPFHLTVMYDFFINANGAVLDSCGRGPDFWGTRDLGWNSGIRCQTRVESGYWTIEAAIPLAALGLPDAAKPTCRFLVGRIEKRSNETSAWQHLSRAFHIVTTVNTAVCRPSSGNRTP